MKGLAIPKNDSGKVKTFTNVWHLFQANVYICVICGEYSLERSAFKRMCEYVDHVANFSLKEVPKIYLCLYFSRIIFRIVNSLIVVLGNSVQLTKMEYF